MRVIYFGATDEGVSPRIRILREGLKRAGVDVVECRASGRFLTRYGRLVRRGRRVLGGADLILVSKPGQREVPLAWALGRAYGIPVVHDFFCSLWINQVGERKRISPHSFLAKKLAWMDRVALKGADLSLIDTRAHGEVFVEQFGVTRDRLRRVFVGAEDIFRPLPRDRGPDFEVLFCGTYIPFHGVSLIVEAAQRLRHHRSIRFTLLGDGPERKAVQSQVARAALDNVTFEDPIPYEALPERLAQASLCLGLFGTSKTAQAVIPKKVFAALACGRPVLTAKSPGILEALDESCAYFCAPGDAQSLARSIEEIADDASREEIGAAGRDLHERHFRPDVIGEALRRDFEELLERRTSPRTQRSLVWEESR